MKKYFVVAATAGLIAGCTSGSDLAADDNPVERISIEVPESAVDSGATDPVNSAPTTTTTVAPTTTTTVAPTTTTTVAPGGSLVIEASQELTTTDDDDVAARSGDRQPAAAPAPSVSDRLVVPSVGIDVSLYPSWDDAVFDGGHGGISPYSSQLDTPTGNISIGAHRSSHGAPFRNLWNLQSGDTATVVRPDGSTRSYRFVEHDMVPSTGVHIALPDYLVDGADSGLTLWACTCQDGSAGCISHRVVARFVEI